MNDDILDDQPTLQLLDQAMGGLTTEVRLLTTHRVRSDGEHQNVSLRLMRDAHGRWRVNGHDTARDLYVRGDGDSAEAAIRAADWALLDR